MVTHPKIEALWLPKGKQRSQTSTMDNDQTVNDNNNISNIEVITNVNGNKDIPSSQKNNNNSNNNHHRIHVPILRNLLAALSFEHQQHPSESTTTESSETNQQQQQQRTVQSSTQPTLQSSGIVDDNHHKTKERTQIAKNRSSNNRFFQSSKVLRGSFLNNDQSEIFYDALEYGNAPNKDDFLPDSPRESIVLAGVTTSIRHDTNQNHNVVETVLNYSDTNDDHDKNKSVEYTEHEYSTRMSNYGNIDSNIQPPDKDTISTSTTSIVRGQELTLEGTLMPPMSPPPPTELPLRFLRAGKNDPVEGLRRYQATLQMRKEQKIDTILREPSEKFHIIKQYYPHYCHFRGKNNEPCFYEQPPKTNLKELRKNGITLDKLLRHYTMVTEYQWQYIERDDLAKSIYIIDLDGIRMTDFVGEAVDFVKRASAFSAQHYPERAGYVFVINVPGWFKLIWNVVKPIIDEDTLKKIYILRGTEEIRNAMQERIPLEHIPPEYGGTSVPLGQSPQEKTLAEWVQHNNMLAEQKRFVCNDYKNCKFCTWIPARSY